MRADSGRSFASTNWGVRIERLGYSLYADSRDEMGRVWRYSVFPHGAGSTGRFNTLRELAAWVRAVETTRWLQQEGK